MSIYATKFVKLYSYECFVSLSKGSSDSLAVSQNCKSEKATGMTIKRLCVAYMQCATALCNLEIVAILLGNIRKSLKFHRCESLRNLVSLLI